MASKYFEVRDCGTLIPVVATRLDHNPIVRRAGFNSDLERHVIVTALTSLKTYHAQGFIEGRTMRVAASHIYSNWDSLVCGQVIDVEFILGESNAPKTSDL
jgi:hypothetical protein